MFSRQNWTAWVALVVTSCLAAWVTRMLGLSAGWLIGPMAVAILFSLKGSGLELGIRPMQLAQALIGASIAASLQPGMIGEAMQNPLPILAAISITLLGSLLVGFVLIRFTSLPGSTGAWGTLPGAAAAMAPLADEYGGDGRIVAVMQYLRVGVVVLVTSLVVGYLAGGGVGLEPRGAPQPSEPYFRLEALNLAVTLMVAIAGIYLAQRFKIMAGALIVPVLVGGLLSVSGVLVYHVPAYVMAVAFMVVGWVVGLKFRRDVVRVVVRNAPAMIGAIVLMMLLCALAGCVLVECMGVDVLTAYLATSPGGLDSIAVIALSAKGDMGLITTVQALRLFFVVLLGPIAVKWITRWCGAYAS